MPTVKSYPDVTTDWTGLLEAGARNPDLLPSIQTEIQDLTATLSEVQGLKARQEELKAQRQEVTQQLNAAVARGKEIASRIRSVARGKIGPKSERLVHFRVPPVRRRPRRLGGVEEKKTDGETGTGQGTSASPSAKPVA